MGNAESMPKKRGRPPTGNAKDSRARIADLRARADEMFKDGAPDDLSGVSITALTYIADKFRVNRQAEDYKRIQDEIAKRIIEIDGGHYREEPPQSKRQVKTASASMMKDTFSFNNHSIGIRVFDGVPHFCAHDIAQVCGYTSGLPLNKEDKPIRSGSYNFISLHKVGAILSRSTGDRRNIAIELLDAIQREFVAAIPVPSAPIAAAPIESDYERKIKANILEMEIDELRAQESAQMVELHRMSKAIKGTRGRIFERERELSELRGQSVLRLVSPGASAHG